MRSGLAQWLLLGGLVLAVAGAYVTWRSLRSGPLPAGDVPSVNEIRDDAPLPDFKLRGPKGEFTNASLGGHWSFMFFGYTQCPDICPTALTLMKEVRTALLAPDAVSPAPTFQVVFISVDPRRDTADLLGAYMAAFDASFIGVSGDDAALAPLAKKLGAYYQRNDGADTRHYSVDHSAAIYLIDPRGRLAAVFPPPQDTSKLAVDYRRIARY